MPQVTALSDGSYALRMTSLIAAVVRSRAVWCSAVRCPQSPPVRPSLAPLLSLAPPLPLPLQTLAEALDAPTLASSLLPFILGYARDPVPNIRFNVAKACERLAPRLDAATRTTVVKPVVMALAASTEEADVQFFASKALAVM